MQERHLNRMQYFREQANTSRDFYVGYVNRFSHVNPGSRVLEIGCGEGGNLLPFAESGCKVTGVDIDSHRIQQSQYFFELSGASGDFLCRDFMNFPPPENEDDRYDIILIHDVIEHIPPSDKFLFLSHLHGFLRCGGVVFFGFPAWQNPFGGHQQISMGVGSKLPFIHLLPNTLYRFILRLSGSTLSQIGELERIKCSKVTIEMFEKLAASAGFTIVDRTLWLINPHYQQKFNLTARRLWPLFVHLPYLRNYLTTSAFYILTSKE